MIAEEIKRKVSTLESENIKLKQLIAQLDRDLTEKDKKPMACEVCKHFIQHYVREPYGFMPIWHGHCTRCRAIGKLKSRDETCKYFELGKY